MEFGERRSFARFTEQRSAQRVCTERAQKPLCRLKCFTRHFSRSIEKTLSYEETRARARARMYNERDNDGDKRVAYLGNNLSGTQSSYVIRVRRRFTQP